MYNFTHPWWWRQYAPLKRRSTIILHGSTTQDSSEHHTRRRENLKSHKYNFVSKSAYAVFDTFTTWKI
jgi:hypothetical protein